MEDRETNCQPYRTGNYVESLSQSDLIIAAADEEQKLLNDPFGFSAQSSASKWDQLIALRKLGTESDRSDDTWGIVNNTEQIRELNGDYYDPVFENGLYDDGELEEEYYMDCGFYHAGYRILENIPEEDEEDLVSDGTPLQSPDPVLDTPSPDFIGSPVSDGLPPQSPDPVVLDTPSLDSLGSPVSDRPMENHSPEPAGSPSENSSVKEVENIPSPEPDQVNLQPDDISLLKGVLEVEDNVAQNEKVQSPDEGSKRFEDTLADVQLPKRYSKPEERVENKHAPGVVILGADTHCVSCGKRVYEMEKLITDKAVYHKFCFKCVYCKRTLQLGNYASLDNQLYCKPHYLELFKTKGELPSPQMAMENGKPDFFPQNDGKDDEDLENLPSIKNLKNVFESGDDATPPVAREKPVRKTRTWEGEKAVNGVHEDSPERDPNIYREVRVKEEVPLSDSLGSLKSRYESAALETAVAPSKKNEPLWEPHEEHEPSPPIDRQDGEEYLKPEELPQADITRNLVARFRELESADEIQSPPDRKPVRKITPPRMELPVYHPNGIDKEESPDRDPNIIRAGDKIESEEEIPPKCITKSLLAKFKELESGATEAAPSPEVSATNQRAAYAANKPRSQRGYSPSDTAQQRPVIETAVEAGEFENTPDVRPDVMREGDVDEEAELPEVGYTKSMLSQWKQKETETADIQRTTPPPPKKLTQWKPRYIEHTEKVDLPSLDYGAKQNGTLEDLVGNVDAGVFENQPEVLSGVVRSDSYVDESEVIPPAYTRSLVARYKSLTEETDQGKNVPVKRDLADLIKADKMRLKGLTSPEPTPPSSSLLQNNVEHPDYNEFFHDDAAAESNDVPPSDNVHPNMDGGIYPDDSSHGQ